jgi:hypothetical protein
LERALNRQTIRIELLKNGFAAFKEHVAKQKANLEDWLQRKECIEPSLSPTASIS